MKKTHLITSTDDGYHLPKPLIKSLGNPIIFWNLENLNIKTDDKV